MIICFHFIFDFHLFSFRIILSTLTLVVLISTIIHLFSKRKFRSSSSRINWFHIFSFIKNSKTLTSPMESHLKITEAIQVLSLILIFCSHCFFISITSVHGIKRIIGLPLKFLQSDEYALIRNFHTYETLFMI